MTYAEPVPPTARTYAAAAAFVALFAAYGSFVPFHFVPRPMAEAVGAWEWVTANRWAISSRSDGVANILLGLPLGFALLGWRRVDRTNLTKTLVIGLILWPACVLFAFLLEFGQLFFPGRTASMSDVIAQSLGSLVGILLFAWRGERLTEWMRLLWAGPRVGGTIGKLLVTYAAVLFVVLMLPMDISASPADAYRKLRDHVTYLPFGELRGDGAKWPAWAELFGLFVPLGVILSARDGVWRTWPAAGRVFLAGFAAGLAVEVLQLLVKSRTTSVSDAVVAGLGVLTGWAVGLAVAVGRTADGLDLEAALILGQAWLFLLLAINWHPYQFDRSRVGGFEVVPFSRAEQSSPLFALEDATTKILLYAPLGAIAAAVGVGAGGWRRIGTAVGVAVGVAVVIELGQLFLPTRFAGPTDVIYAAAGGWLGGVAVQRLRANGLWNARIRAFTVPPLSTIDGGSVPFIRLPSNPSFVITPPPFGGLLDPDDAPIHVRLTTTDYDE